jgi:hypothetical protein
MHATTLAADGYVVLRDVLGAVQLQELQLECDALCAALAAEGVRVADEGCVVEAFRRSRPAPRAAARTERAAYVAARRAAVAALCGDSDTEQREAALEQALFRALPAAVRSALGAAGEATQLCVFNEQFVVKPANSACTFAWHRDAEEQLALCTDLQGCAAPYFSVWLPLDDCDASNGTLVVLPRSAEVCTAPHAPPACAALTALLTRMPCSRGSLSKLLTPAASRYTCRLAAHACSPATSGMPAAATAAPRRGVCSTRSIARRRS